MEKHIAAAFWDADIPVARVIDTMAGGRHIGEQLEKYAEGEGDTARALRDAVTSRGLDPDRAYIHVITNGAMEFYSANDNGDGFNEKEGSYRSPETGGTIKLAGGLKGFHSTYTNGGAGVYHKHRNSRKTDPATGRPFEKRGEIEAEAYNDKMHRGEVIISVVRRDPFWRKPLEKCANGEQLYWSMGTTVPFDVCSSCLNKAASRAQYCTHLRNNLGGLTKEGRRVMAINDRTTYHDLSLVDIPAFRIAGTLAKVAGRGNVRPEFVPADEPGMKFVNPARAERRHRLLQKLAEMEKKVPAVSAEKPLLMSLDRTCGEESEIAEKLKGLPLDVLANLEKSHRTLLPSRTFTIILLGKGTPELSEEGVEVPSCLSEPDWLDLIPAKLPGVFSRLLKTGRDAVESCCPVCGTPARADHSVFSKALPDLDTGPQAAERRIMIRVIRKPDEHVKEASAIPREWHEAAELAALEYARHQLDVVETCPELMKLAVLQNNAAGTAAQAQQTQ